VRVVSANALRAMLAQETGEVFLVCLTLNHSSFSAPYLLVNDMQQLVRTAGTFQPFAFEVTLPNEQEDQVPQVQVTIDNVDRSILQAVRTIGAERPAMTMEVVLASSPNTIEAGPFNFSILNINYDVGQIQGTIGFEDDFLNTAFPADTYTPNNSRGLFA
jgi:hypothetical protein